MQFLQLRELSYIAETPKCVYRSDAVAVDHRQDCHLYRIHSYVQGMWMPSVARVISILSPGCYVQRVRPGGLDTYLMLYELRIDIVHALPACLTS